MAVRLNLLHKSLFSTNLLSNTPKGVTRDVTTLRNRQRGANDGRPRDL
jgi:hypothetical protein